MKKRSSTRRSSARKTRKYRAKSSTFLFPFSLRRIVLITTCIALFVIGFVFIKGEGRQSVAGVHITNGLFVQAKVTIPQVENAVSYNIYYKEKNDSMYKNAVREVSPNIKEYNISYLTKGTEYVHKVSAVNLSGAEFWWSAEKPLDNLEPM